MASRKTIRPESFAWKSEDLPIGRTDLVRMTTRAFVGGQAGGLPHLASESSPGCSRIPLVRMSLAGAMVAWCRTLPDLRGQALTGAGVCSRAAQQERT